jgi:nitrogen fixation NifU-like protein
MTDAGSASLSAMYQEELLAHYRAPSNRRELPEATARAARRNPLCGDALEVAIQLDVSAPTGPLLADVAFTGRGCSIAVASASMMTAATRGLNPDEALELVALVDAMLTRTDPASELPHTLAALRAVAPFPGRHGCASMPWLALRDALRDALHEIA